jgi:hypothetical protein
LIFTSGKIGDCGTRDIDAGGTCSIPALFMMTCKPRPKDRAVSIVVENWRLAGAAFGILDTLILILQRGFFDKGHTAIDHNNPNHKIIVLFSNNAQYLSRG